jgi:hypothetical protein
MLKNWAGRPETRARRLAAGIQGPCPWSASASRLSLPPALNRRKRPSQTTHDIGRQPGSTARSDKTSFSTQYGMLRVFLRRFFGRKRGREQRPAPRLHQGPGVLRVAQASGRRQPADPAHGAIARSPPAVNVLTPVARLLLRNRSGSQVRSLNRRQRLSVNPPVAGATPTPGRRRGHPASPGFEAGTCCASFRATCRPPGAAFGPRLQRSNSPQASARTSL